MGFSQISEWKWQGDKSIFCFCLLKQLSFFMLYAFFMPAYSHQILLRKLDFRNLPPSCKKTKKPSLSMQKCWCRSWGLRRVSLWVCSHLADMVSLKWLLVLLLPAYWSYITVNLNKRECCHYEHTRLCTFAKTISDIFCIIVAKIIYWTVQPLHWGVQKMDEWNTECSVCTGYIEYLVLSKSVTFTLELPLLTSFRSLRCCKHLLLTLL